MIKTKDAKAIYDKHGVTKWNIRSRCKEDEEARRNATIELAQGGLNPADIAAFESHTFGIKCARSSITFRLGAVKRRYVR